VLLVPAVGYGDQTEAPAGQDPSAMVSRPSWVEAASHFCRAARRGFRGPRWQLADAPSPPNAFAMRWRVYSTQGQAPAGQYASAEEASPSFWAMQSNFGRVARRGLLRRRTLSPSCDLRGGGAPGGGGGPPTSGGVDGDGCGEASARVARPPWSTVPSICCASRRCDGFLSMFIYKTKTILYLVEFFWHRKYWYDIYFSLYKKFVKNPDD
jgi:hypothetical protein